MQSEIVFYNLSRQLSAKVARILSVWAAGQGVVSLHMFQHTTAEEAFAREACMIEAIGKVLAAIYARKITVLLCIQYLKLNFCF